MLIRVEIVIVVIPFKITLQSIHWASSKQKVQSLPEPEAKTPSHGPPEANTPTVSHEPPVEESSNKDMMSGPSKKLRADPEGVDKLATLHQFRRGTTHKHVMSTCVLPLGILLSIMEMCIPHREHSLQ